MAKITDIVEATTTDELFLAKMARRHEARLLSSIGKLRDNITNLLGQLETTPAGRLKGIKVNLKQSQRLHKKIVNEFEKTYNKKVDSMLGDFSEIGTLVDKSYKHLGEAAKFTSIDKVMMNSLRDQTYDRYIQFGTDARDRIARGMYDSVVGGQKMSTLTKTIAGALTGHVDVRGRPMSTYAKGFAQDAIMNFHNQVNIKKGEDLGIDHFLYYGDIIAASRPFCITRAGKTYNKRQIMAWDNLSWKGKSGPPLSERGGYNCRHHWRPVRPEWLNDEDGEPISREEVVAYMNPSPPVNKITAKLDATQVRLVGGQNKLKALQVEQTIFKNKKAAGTVTTAESKAYSELRKKIKAQQVANSGIRSEIKELREQLKGEGKKIIKQAKITAGLKKPKIKKPKKPVLLKDKVKEEVISTKLIETKSGLRVIKYPKTSAKFTSDVVNDLNDIPEHLAKEVRQYGVDINVGRNMSQVQPSLKSVTPRGWVEGKTWENAEGGFNNVRRQITIAEKKLDWENINWETYSPERRRFVVFHEYGHALDRAHIPYGDSFSDTSAFIKAYKKDVKFINDYLDPDRYTYFLQKGYAGRQETFAQLFANLIDPKVGKDISDSFANTRKLMAKEFKLGTKKAKVVKPIKPFKKVNEKWADKQFRKWYGDLSDAELDSLTFYKSAGDSGGWGAETPFEMINSHLRKGTKIDKYRKRDLANITNALSRSTAVINEDIILYRGMSNNMGRTLEKKIGKVVEEKAFLSTTMEKATAYDFVEMKGSKYVMRINAPKGTRGAYMGFEDIDLEGFTEAEILLQRNTKFRILRGPVAGKIRGEPVKFIDVEIVKQTKPKLEKVAGKGISTVGQPKALEYVEDFITTSALSKKPTKEVAKYLEQTVSGDTKAYRGIGAVKQRFTVVNWEKLNNLKVGDEVPDWLTRPSGISSYTKKKSLAKKYSEGTVEIVVEADIPAGAIVADLENLGKMLKNQSQNIFDAEDIKYMIGDKELMVREPIKARIVSIKGTKGTIQPVPPMTQTATAAENYTRRGKSWYLKGEKVSESIADDLNKLRIPPSWTDVVVSTDKTAKIQAMGMDKAGRWQYRYSAEHIAEASRLKFDNVRKFSSDMPTIRKNIWKGMNAGDDRAFLLELENRTVIRAGTSGDLKAKTKAYGLTTLQNEHVVIRGNRIILDFVAKEGIPAHYELVDKNLADWLRVKKNATTRGQKLFPDISAKKLNKYLKEVAGEKRYTIKDFRTYHGTRIAYEELKKYGNKILTAPQKKSIIKEVSEKVADFLHNTPAMAKKSYIDPTVWDFIGGL